MKEISTQKKKIKNKVIVEGIHTKAYLENLKRNNTDDSIVFIYNGREI